MAHISPPSRDSYGFTIVELLIVIIVIGILAGIVYVSYGAVVTSSRSNNASANAKVMQRKIEAYASINNSYPASTTAAAYTADLNSYGDSSIVTAQISIGTPGPSNGASVMEVSQCQSTPGGAYRIRNWDYATKALSTTIITGTLSGSACNNWKILT